MMNCDEYDELSAEVRSFCTKGNAPTAVEEVAPTEVQEEPSADVKKKPRDPYAPKRKYELKNISRKDRITLCRSAARVRHLEKVKRQMEKGIHEVPPCCVIRVSRETKDEVVELAEGMQLTYGEVVQMALDTFKEAMSKI